MSAGVDRERHGQRVVDRDVGDCFRACMSVLLDLPNGDHLPTLTTENMNGRWMAEWRAFLAGFGLAVLSSHPKGPIWKSHPWIASVPSKNIGDRTHAIVVDGRHKVMFDPSPRRRYRAGTGLLSTDLVLEGTWIEMADASKLHRLDRFRRELTP